MWRLGEAAHRCPHPASLLFVAHTPPHFLEVEHLLWGRRQKACFDLRQVLDVRGEPARTRLPRHGKEACHPTQAPALSANPQHGVVLGLPRGWLWLEHARRATVLAMVLSIPTPIGSLFGLILTFGESSSIMWNEDMCLSMKKGTSRNYKLSNSQM